MPPKKTTAPAKPAAKGPSTKTKTTTGSKPAASKGAAGGASQGAAAAGSSTTEPAKVENKPAIKKLIEPTDIGLKEIANVYNYAGDVGLKLQDSKRWLLVIDYNGNVGTFLKYRDVNYLLASLQPDMMPETIRLAFMGSLRFGKPVVVDITDTDNANIMDVVKERMDEIYKGFYDDVLDRSITNEDKYMKLHRDSDDDEYKETYNYKIDKFQMIVLTNTDPPSSIMGDFFPVNVR